MTRIFFQTNNLIFKDVVDNLNFLFSNTKDHKNLFLKQLFEFTNKNIYKTDTKIKLVAIEGTIGAGKTSFLKHFTPPHSIIIEEPVHVWINEIFVTINDVKKNILEAFYKNGNSLFVTYGFQILALITRYYYMISISNQSEHLFVDRSIKTDLIFKRMACDPIQNGDGDESTKNDLDEIYSRIHDHCTTILESKFIINYIFLDVSPSIAMCRIKKRGRESENNISISYIEKLCKEMKSVFEKIADFKDWNKNIDLTFETQ